MRENANGCATEGARGVEPRGAEPKGGLTRRSFLGTAALAGLATAAAGLVGCSSNQGASGAAAASDDAKATDNVTAQAADQEAASAVTGGNEVYTAWSEGLNPQRDDFRQTSGDLSHVLSPWKLGDWEFSNRIVKSAAGSGYIFGGWDIFTEYYERFAQGGVEMIWCEGLFHCFGPYANNKYDDVDEIGDKYDFASFIDRVHQAGAKIGIQLDTSSSDYTTELTARGGGRYAESLTAEEVAWTIERYIHGAEVAKQLGFDAVELNCAGENLPQWFLSGAGNHRDDDYGPQTFENRTRFVAEIVRGIHEACGADFPVEVLMNGVEENDAELGVYCGANTVAEGIEIAKQLEAAGVDCIQVRIGALHNHIGQFMSDALFNTRGCAGQTGYGTQYDFDRHFDGKLISEYNGCGIMLDVAKEYKDALSIPVGTVSYVDPALAPDLFDQAIAEGKADYFVLNRALCVDPEYVSKMRDGRLDEVRPCMRCGHCFTDQTKDMMMTFGGYGISDACRVDATKMFIGGDRGLVGSWDPNPADGDKSVMVVGAGPAGMEAARVAAQRGYRVALYEKESQLGGLSTFASAIKGPRENIARWLAWCEKQLELEGVTVVTGTEVDAAFVREQAPDVLMLATGGARTGSGLASVGATNVISLADIAGAEVGERVTILGSNLQATDLAFYLIEQGKAVSIVTPDTADLVSKGQANWVKQLSTPMLYARGTRLWPQAEVTSVGDGEVTVRMASGATTTYPCDTVIEAFDMVPNKGMLDELADSGIALHAIGDCDDPWNIQYAIRAGNHTARTV